jgi:hypothetical protein
MVFVRTVQGLDNNQSGTLAYSGEANTRASLEKCEELLNYQTAEIFDSSRQTTFWPATVCCKIVLWLIFVADKLIATNCSRTSIRCTNVKWTVATGSLG